MTLIDDYIVGHTKPVLWLMFTGAVLMLVLACSSVAGLQVFRAARQDRAIAIQLAIGASRARLMRASLYESGMIACVGAGAAIAVAWALTRALIAIAPPDVPGLADATVAQPRSGVVVALARDHRRAHWNMAGAVRGPGRCRPHPHVRRADRHAPS